MNRSRSSPENRIARVIAFRFPEAEVEREFRILEPIYRCGELIRQWVRVDFRAVIEGIDFIIEYNGRQHYEPKAFSPWDSETKIVERFRLQRIRDWWLKRRCEDCGIQLIVLNGHNMVNQLELKVSELIDERLHRCGIRPTPCDWLKWNPSMDPSGRFGYVQGKNRRSHRHHGKKHVGFY